MAVTEQVILDLTRAQAQIRDLDREFQALAAPITVDVQLDADDDITRLRRDLSNVDATVNIDVSGLQAIDEAADDANRLEQEFSQARVEAAKVADQADRIKRELREADNATIGFGGRVGEIATALAAFQGARAAFNFLAAGVQDAAALGESINRINILFGDLSGEIIAFSENSTAALVLTQRELLDAVGTFAGLANVVGLTREESVQFGTTLTDLAADLASFGDTSVDEAVLALGSALRGESEPIRRYNVLLNEAAVTSKALELGLGGATGELDEAAKVQARYALILEQTVIAQGDLAATQDSLGNRLKSTRVDFLELRQELGEAVVPALEDLLDVLPGVIELVGSAAPLVGDLANQFGNIVGPVGEFAGILSDIVDEAGPLVGLLGEAGEQGSFLADAGQAIKDAFVPTVLPIIGLFEEFNRAYRSAFGEEVELPGLGRGGVVVDRILTERLADGEALQLQTLLTSDAVAGLVDGYRQLDAIGSGGIGDAGTAAERSAAQLLAFNEQLEELDTAARLNFAPLQSELQAIGQAFEDTFDPNKNGDVFASIDELVADINKRFADAAEFESGLAELARRGFDDAAAVFRERGPETIGLLREALADSGAAAELEGVLDAVGTAAGQGYAEGFAVGFAAESPAIALEIAASVDNASVREGIIAGAQEQAALFAANFNPVLLLKRFQIDVGSDFVRGNFGSESDLEERVGGVPATAQGSARGFNVTIINPTVTDLDTSVGQATSTLGAISGLVQ